MHTRILAAIAAVLLTAGCASGGTYTRVVEQELPFLQVGVVDRSHVLLRMTAEPTVHDRGRVLIYDLWRTPYGVLSAQRRDASHVAFHLVLLFDDEDQLQDLNLVAVQPCRPHDSCLTQSRRDGSGGSDG